MTIPCAVCGSSERIVSRELRTCLSCIRKRPAEALPFAHDARTRARRPFGLPTEPPDDTAGILCQVCANVCVIGKGSVGYCGLRRNVGGRLEGVSADRGRAYWYSDPLPTNCVADWVCAGGTGAGYPRYACRRGPETGYRSLAVFLAACSMECLFCQNWAFRAHAMTPDTVTAQALAEAADEHISCICFFGGDPSPQMPFALRASRLALEEAGHRILRICWETNGSMNREYMDQALNLSAKSGGCVKFDLKAHDENLAVAMTGMSNRRTLENFTRAARRARKRPEPPLVVASTLVVPGYVDIEEVRAISRFIASVNPEIPYALLAFSPTYRMDDLPLLTLDEAREMEEAALAEGLRKVRWGNLHLLRAGGEKAPEAAGVREV